MTLSTLSESLDPHLAITDICIGTSFANNCQVWSYFSQVQNVESYLMDCDLSGAAMDPDEATLFVKYGGSTHNTVITISTSDNASIDAVIEALISAP